MGRPKVLITNKDSSKVVLEILSEHCEVIEPEEISKEGILSKVKGVDGIFFKHPIRIDKDIIEEAGPSLKIIACMSTGVELIDTDEVRKRGIKLANTAGANSDSVAELAVLLILAASRRAQESRWAIEKIIININLLNTTPKVMMAMRRRNVVWKKKCGGIDGKK